MRNEIICGECGEVVIGMEAILPEGVICRKCLTRKIKESAPACVRGKYMYYGEPADRLYVESGLPKFKNDAGISVYDLGGEYAVCTNYTIYGINTKIGTLPAVNCERHKSISAALDAGLREINRELEKHVAEYPLKVAEIRALTKRLKEKLAPTIFS